MTDEDRKRDASADALRAMAGGEEPTPGDAEKAKQAAEADQLQDDSDVLAALAGQGSAPGIGQDGLDAGVSLDAAMDLSAAAELAATTPGGADQGARGAGDEDLAAALAAADLGPVDLAAELAAHASGEAGAEPGYGGAGPSGPAFAGAGAVLTPEQKRARAAQFDRQSRHAHAYQFKKTMIPLLIVVAAVLLIMGTMAVFVPSGGGSAAGRGAPQTSPIEEYRPWLILSAYVVGPILLLGAWLFYLDVKRSDRRVAASRKQQEGDSGR